MFLATEINQENALSIFATLVVSSKLTMHSGNQNNAFIDGYQYTVSVEIKFAMLLLKQMEELSYSIKDMSRSWNRSQIAHVQVPD